MGHLEYIALLVLCLLITAPLELLLGVGVYRELGRLARALGCVGLVFVGWDLLGARLGHWDYQPSSVTGLRLLGLPVEEYLFFLVVPLCGIMAYEAVRVTLDDAGARHRNWWRRRRRDR
jgi:lycopene cyclase domain-containing protein